MRTTCMLPFPKANFGAGHFHGDINRENFEKISRFELAYLKQSGFLPDRLCEEIVAKTEPLLQDYEGVPNVKILPGLPSHFGAKDEWDYVQCANSPANVLRDLPAYKQAVALVLAQLISLGYEAEVLEVNGQNGIGLMFRSMRELRNHTDWVLREIPDWSIIRHLDPTFSQIAVNIDLNSHIASSVTTVVERSYSWTDENFKSTSDMFSYDPILTAGERSADYIMLRGDITYFNSNCYHRVWVSSDCKTPRYTLGGFIVKLKNANKLLLFA